MIRIYKVKKLIELERKTRNSVFFFYSSLKCKTIKVFKKVDNIKNYLYDIVK